MEYLIQSKTHTTVIVDIETEILSYYLQCDPIVIDPLFDEPQKARRINIRHDVLEPWLSAKGYLDWTNDDADYKGEHQQDSGSYSYLDYVRDIITPEIIHEYLFDAGRISLAFDKSQL